MFLGRIAPECGVCCSILTAFDPKLRASFCLDQVRIPVHAKIIVYFISLFFLLLFSAAFSLLIALSSVLLLSCESENVFAK